MATGSNNRALIVVDVQNDFCPGGTLAVPEGDQVVAPLNRLITEFLTNDEPVFASRDWHPRQTHHFAEFGGTWPVHCVQNTPGAEFHPDLIRDPRIQIISKGLGDTDCYSAFDETDLADRLRAAHIDEVWVGGLATDYCVKQTVLDGLKEGFEVKGISDAMRPVEIQPGDGERAIDEMKSSGAVIMSAQELVNSLEERSVKRFDPDPVIEFYKKDVDRDAIRRNLSLTVDQRLERLMSEQKKAAAEAEKRNRP